MSTRLQTYRDGDLTVTFDPTRCIHAAACIRAQPDVFDSAARPWIRLERAAHGDIMRAVQGCPTGALRAMERDQRVDVEPAPVTVRASRNGPLMVRGEVRVITEDGTEIVQDLRLSLCRCGQSKQMPLCDNSHRAAGFRDPVAPQPPQPAG